MRTRLRWSVPTGVLVAMSLGCLAAAQNPKPEFSISISAAENPKAGAPVMININVTSVTDHVIAFDGYSSARWESDFQVRLLDSQGNAPAETQYMKAIRGEDQGPGPTHIVITPKLVQRDLKPGESIKGSLNLTELFDLKPGTYTLTLSRGDFRTGHVRLLSPAEDAEARRSRGNSEQTPVPIKPKAIAESNSITLKVT